MKKTRTFDTRSDLLRRRATVWSYERVVGGTRSHQCKNDLLLYGDRDHPVLPAHLRYTALPVSFHLIPGDVHMRRTVLALTMAVGLTSAGFLSLSALPEPLQATGPCDTSPGGSVSCDCFGDPDLGSLACEGWIIAVEVTCFNDSHCQT
jgi:hypothetical protein